MLKSIEFLRGKSRGRVIGGTKLASPAPVILGLVPRILWKRVSNLVNKFALLLHKCWSSMLSAFCMLFKYPSPDAKASPSPARGEGLYRPWCHKILGTDCASRPRMTGGRGANSFGRSMIEMLGVLTIISVLSVGGLAGYSKAMQKFKLNKWQDDLVMLTANLKITFANSKSYTLEDDVDLTEYFKNLQMIPQGMLDDNNRDIFGNTLSLYSHAIQAWGFGSRLTILVKTLPNSDSATQCKNMFEMLRYYDDAWVVALNEIVTGRDGGILAVCGRSAPEKYAQKMGCVPYNLAEISQKCALCSTQICDIKLMLANGN